MAIKGLVAIHKGAAAIAKAPPPILTLEALALPLQAVRPTGGATDRGIAHSVEAITAAETAAGCPVATGEIATSTEAGAGPAAPPTPLHAATSATATATPTPPAAAAAAATGLEGGLVLLDCGGRADGQERSGGHGHEGSRQEAERGTEWVCHHLTPFRWATRSQPPS